MSSEKFTLPRSARCALSRLRCNGHSSLLGTYLHRVGRAETPLCSNYGSESQDFFHLVLNCPVLASGPMRSATSSLFWTFGTVPGDMPDYWDSTESIRAPIPRNGSGKPTTKEAPKRQNVRFKCKLNRFPYSQFSLFCIFSHKLCKIC